MRRKVSPKATKGWRGCFTSRTIPPSTRYARCHLPLHKGGLMCEHSALTWGMSHAQRAGRAAISAERSDGASEAQAETGDAPRPKGWENVVETGAGVCLRHEQSLRQLAMLVATSLYTKEAFIRAPRSEVSPKATKGREVCLRLEQSLSRSATFRRRRIAFLRISQARFQKCLLWAVAPRCKRPFRSFPPCYPLHKGGFYPSTRADSSSLFQYKTKKSLAAPFLCWLLFCGVNAYLLFVAGNALEFYNAVDESVQRIVAALAYVETRADVCASLSYDDVARKNCRAVGFLHTESLRVTVAAVLRRTNALFMSEKLQTESKHLNFLR